MARSSRLGHCSLLREQLRHVDQRACTLVFSEITNTNWKLVTIVSLTLMHDGPRRIASLPGSGLNVNIAMIHTQSLVRSTREVVDTVLRTMIYREIIHIKINPDYVWSCRDMRLVAS